jgi:nucleoside-diphosphate-sugar epimerase
MKYLITGGTGFIGRGLVRQLLSEGHEIRILDNDSRGSAQKLSDLANSCDIRLGDIRDLQAVTDASVGVDSIIHLAYINGTQYFYTKPYEILEVGLKGMLNVLDASKTNGVSEVVLASTSEAYQTPPSIPTAEDVPLVVPDVQNPRYSYGGGKIASELLLINYAKQFGLSSKIFRPHNVYGPDMGQEHVIPQLIEKVVIAKEKTPTADSISIQIQGDGLQTRAFIYIDDFARSVSIMLKKGLDGNVYHLGNEEEVTILDLVKEIGSALELQIEAIPSEAPKGATNRRCPDISKIASLGYVKEVSLAEGVARTVEWYHK